MFLSHDVSKLSLAALTFTLSFTACSRMQLAEKIPTLTTTAVPAKPLGSECPSLHGVFLDPNVGPDAAPGASTETAVLMNVSGGTIQIAMGQDIIIADGKAHELKGQERTQYRASCDAGELKIVSGPNAEADSKAIKRETVISKLNDDGDLRVSTSDKDSTGITTLKRLYPLPTLQLHVAAECPVITGEFENASDAKESIAVQSGLIDASVVYQIDGRSFNADGQIHAEKTEAKSESKKPRAPYIANCAKGVLTVLGDSIRLTLRKTGQETLERTVFSSEGVRTSTLTAKRQALKTETAAACSAADAAPVASTPVEVTPEPAVAPETLSETAVSDARAVIDAQSKSAESKAPDATAPIAAPIAAPITTAPVTPPEPAKATTPVAEPEEDPYMPADEADSRL